MLRAILAMLVAAGFVHGTASAQELRVGLGVAALPTPPKSALAGYGGIFEREADGVLDVPEVRALVLERGDLRIALVCFDLLLIRPELRAGLLASDAARGLDGLILIATHTHSGPGGYIPGWLAGHVTGARFDPAVAPRLARAAAEALAGASADLHSARAGGAHEALDLAENRRRKAGPRETALELVRIDSAEREPIALIVYAAHPTVLSSRNHAFSADYPGALRRWLAERGWRALFAQGPLGDQQPDQRMAPAAAEPPAIEARQVEAVGAAIGSEVLKDLGGIETRGDAALAFAERVVDAPDPRPRRGCALWWFSPISRPALHRLASPRVALQALRIGDTRLLFVPAEPSADVGALLRAEGGIGVVSLANDWIGYLVSPAEYRRGSYEACMSFAGAQGASWLASEASRTLALLDAKP
jgi:neutral ceramidase